MNNDVLLESKGVPDPDNIDVLIENIIKRLKNEVLVQIYSFPPISGLKPPSNIDGIITLERDINPCKWLGNDVFIEYHCSFFNDNTICNGMFCEIDDGTCVVEDSNEEFNIPPTIHGVKIILNLNIGNDIYTAYGRINKEFVNDSINKIKTVLMHELTHSYQELNKQLIFNKDNDNKNDFMDGYSYVVSVLNNINFFNEKSKERDFLMLLYTTTYIEINSNVASFYQRIINDFDNSDTLMNISSYFEYKTYHKNLSLLNGMHDDRIYEKYKDVIIKIYGDGASIFGKFKARMRYKNKKAIEKMTKCYNYVREHGKITKMTLENAMEVYNTGKKKFLVDNVPSDPFEKYLFEMVSSHNIYTDIDKLLYRVNTFFSVTN